MSDDDVNATDVDEHEGQRQQEDELIRQYLLAQAKEWAEYEHQYGWQRNWKTKVKAA